MQMIATYALIVLACAVLNRVRGTDVLKKVGLPGHGRLYVSPVIGGLAWFAGVAPLYAAGFAAAYFFWSLFAWGRWFDLNRLPEGFNREGDKPDALEGAIMSLTRDDYVALFIRHCLALPVAYLAWPFGLAFPFLAVAAYEVGWRVKPMWAVLIGEVIVGTVWGALIIAAAI
jgi:hypothetical protein